MFTKQAYISKDNPKHCQFTLFKGSVMSVKYNCSSHTET